MKLLMILAVISVSCGPEIPPQHPPPGASIFTDNNGHYALSNFNGFKQTNYLGEYFNTPNDALREAWNWYRMAHPSDNSPLWSNMFEIKLEDK